MVEYVEKGGGFMLWLIPAVAAVIICVLVLKRRNPAVSANASDVGAQPTFPDPADTVLVGALASAGQLYVSLSHNFYHTPAALVGDGYKSIKYVAIYQSRRFFGADAGVRYWGKVASARRVPRHEITEIDKGGRGL